MRILMIQNKTVQPPGGGQQHYAAGRFYMVEDQTAAVWIAAGDACPDPEQELTEG